MKINGKEKNRNPYKNKNLKTHCIQARRSRYCYCWIAYNVFYNILGAPKEPSCNFSQIGKMVEHESGTYSYNCSFLEWFVSYALTLFFGALTLAGICYVGYWIYRWFKWNWRMTL